jgi:uracil-DNA glycosylase family 4
VFVPSSRPASGHTKLVIVGEAPGVQEAKTGVPFTGPSGKLLDAVLHGSGYRRSDVFITNACLCRPKDNATPGAKDVAACAPRLGAELSKECDSGAPIVVMGNVAASAVFDRKVKILSERVGGPKTSHRFPGVPVIATVHPAYVLRVPDALPLLVDDMAKTRPQLQVNWEEPVYKVFEGPSAARRALRELGHRGKQSVVVDIEVGAEKDETFDRPDKLRLLCVGLCYAPGRAIVIGERALWDQRVRAELAWVLEKHRVVAHNGKFDLAGLRRITTGARLGFDTMLASYVCDERSGTHGLKYLARERLGAPDYAALIHKYISRKGENFAHVPTEILHKYNAYDVACTWGLMRLYEERMHREGLTKVHDMLCRASDMLQQVESRGLRVDLDYLEKIKLGFENDLADLDESLSRWVENARSPMQVTVALAKLGYQVGSTNIAVLNKLAEITRGEAKQFVNLLIEHRRQSKLYGTYAKGILGRISDGRVHPTFLLHGTTTGRLSCRNPNLQNIPRESSIKRMFVPGEGRCFVQADYATIELRVIACESKDEYLRRMFAEERDIHSEVAASFFGPNFTKQQRVWAKGVVYGLSYGREAYSLAQAAGIPTAEAEKYLRTFLGLIPGAMAWRDGIKHQVLETDDDLTTAYGRHRRVLLVTDENKTDTLKESYAFVPQSTASDICLNAAIELHERHGLDIRLLVHDSILVETDEPDEVAALMHEVMPRVAAETYSDFVPFPVETAVGTNWSEV